MMNIALDVSNITIRDLKIIMISWNHVKTNNTYVADTV